MTTEIIIPARLASQRLPEKILKIIQGKTMIEHTYESAVAANLGPVSVACCSQEVAQFLEKKKIPAFVTPPELSSGTDRIYHALCQKKSTADIVINVQGDMPFFPPSLLEKSQQIAKTYAIGTLVTPLSLVDATSPDAVKVVTAWTSEHEGRALYFSRCAIPYGAKTYDKHIGIYAYQRNALEKFVNLPPSPLEKLEKLEQLRALENGLSLGVARVDAHVHSIDTPQDLLTLHHALLS